MNARTTHDWSQKVEQVIRSRHYTWLGEGLGGIPPEDAMVALTADVMHICRHEGIPWDRVLRKSSEQFEHEEHAEFETQAAV